MPAIVFTTLRYLIIAGVQLGIFAVIENWILPLLDDAAQAIMEFFGVEAQEAQDILANEYLQIAEQVGITAAVIASRTPLKIADKLGFSGKGFGKRPLKAATAEKVAKAKGSGAVAPAKSSELAKVGEVGGTIAQRVKGSTGFFLYGEVFKIIGLVTGVMYMIAQYLDYGNWPSGTFHSFFAAVFAKLGLPENKPMPSSAILSKDTWNSIFNTYKVAGATGINDPFKNQSVPFTAQNLVDLVDKVAAQLKLDTGGATAKQVLAATQGFLILNEPMTDAKIAAVGKGNTLTAQAAPVQSAYKATKVFTGVMSAGVLGEKIAFTERQDDLITSLDELTTAAQNNLAPWLASLLGKVLYEIRLVNSVTTKDGVVLAGSTQQIVSRYDSHGKAIYKTVRNRFATMSLSVLTDRGTKVKLATITLGPTDALKLQPSLEQLADLTKKIGGQVLTNKVEDIKTIATIAPLSVTTPTIVLSAATQAAPALPQSAVAPVVAVAATPQVQKVATLAPVVAPPGQAVPAWKQAQTLSEFYSLTGRDLPPLSERGRLYANYGLGQSAYYTGTAEQNTKLLNYILSHYSPD